MKATILMYLFSSFFLLGGNKNAETISNDQFCNVDNPLEEIKWLSEIVEGHKDSPIKVEIYKCIYNYQEGFLIDNCVRCPDGMVEFYNCEGTVICEFGGFDGRNTCPDFESSVSNMELIWTNTQLTVDAGNDVMVCYPNSNEERTQLTGVASGGVEPYTYTWSGKEIKHLSPDDSVWVYASDLLNDTTIINPSFKSMDAPEDWFTFYLKVEDAAGNVEVDSVKIIDAFIFSGGAYKLPVTIRRGDSIQFFGNPFVFSSNFPLEYSITPTTGLNDSKDFYGWAKPNTSTTYYIQAVNSAGCVAKSYYWSINVDTTTVSANSLDSQLAKCYLSQGNLMIHLPQKQSIPYEVTIATSNGSMVYRAQHSERELRLKGLGLKANQLYIVSIDDGKEKQVFKVLGN